MKPLLLLLSLIGLATAGTYQNPVISGFAPDPSICAAGEDFYLVNSSFSMFPGLPVYKSKDLVNWEIIGHAASDRDQAPLLGGDSDSGFWAPTIRHHQGTFYVIVKNQTASEIVLLSTKDPAGKWSDKLVVGGNHWSEGIDPDLFFDQDGTCYVTKPTWHDEQARFHAWKLDLTTGAVSDPRELWRGEGRGYEEGPHLYRRNGYYYLLLAEGGTGDQHCVTIARRKADQGLGESPDDWEACPANPIVFNDPKLNPEVHATGHADLIKDMAGNWWMLHLGIRYKPAPNLGRETFLAPVEWIDDWPVVNAGKAISRTMTSALKPDPHIIRKQPIRDEFKGTKLSLEWNFLRNPELGSWSLSNPTDSLTLRSTGHNLASKQSVAFVGRRLRSKQCRFAAEVHATPVAEGASGICLFSRQESYVEMVVTSSDDGPEVVVRRNADGLVKTLAATSLPKEMPVVLEFIIQDELIFSRLSFDHGHSWQTVHKEHVEKMVSGPNFAGLYFGMHCTGSNNTAVFNWSEYENLERSLQVSEITNSIRQLREVEKTGFNPNFTGNGLIEVEHGELDGPQVEGTAVGFIENGSRISLPRIPVIGSPKRVTARLASMSSGGQIELHTNPSSGSPITTIEFSSTGSWTTWKEVSAPITNLDPGLRDLLLVFRGGDGYLMNLDWLRFDTSPE